MVLVDSDVEQDEVQEPDAVTVVNEANPDTSNTSMAMVPATELVTFTVSLPPEFDVFTAKMLPWSPVPPLCEMIVVQVFPNEGVSEADAVPAGV